MAHGATPDGNVEVVAENLTVTLNLITGWALERGLELNDLSVVRPTLEDVYLELTGRPQADAGAEPGPWPGGRSRRAGRRQRGTVQ